MAEEAIDLDRERRRLVADLAARAGKVHFRCSTPRTPLH
jgi:hypothetical protein